MSEAGGPPTGVLGRQRCSKDETASAKPLNWEQALHFDVAARRPV